MYTIGITGDYLKVGGEVLGIDISGEINNHRRASMFFVDKQYAYLPIRSIETSEVKNIDVFNFSVTEDESYLAENLAVHNCSAPVYTSDSLHSAVVEIIIKKGASVQYTTIQNWSGDVYNLVTKRARVEEEGKMSWVDCNIGSKLTMKYPSCYLVGKGATGETLSLAVAKEHQHQDTGAKIIHAAPHTTSTVISKSISLRGGRTSYRGLVDISKTANNCKTKVKCDALLLDPQSRTDTYPTMKINRADAMVEHEATVSKVGEEQLFYMQSRGLKQDQAEAMIVNGFASEVIKQLPMEYALELNRLIELEMEGSVG